MYFTSKQYLITSESPRGFPFNPFMRRSLKGGLRQSYILPHSHLVPGIDRHRHGQKVEEGDKHPLEENALPKKNENTRLLKRKPDLGKCFPLLFEQLCNNPSFQHVQMLRLDPIQDQDDGGTPILKIILCIFLCLCHKVFYHFECLKYLQHILSLVCPLGSIESRAPSG